jgi:flap endonuclease-1
MIQSGIKPIWVFDGIPPSQKKKELSRRKKIKYEAKEKMAEAKEVGDLQGQLKQHQRQVKMTDNIIDDAIKMIRLMGLPVIKASAEAEAQCVELLKNKLVDAVASEDMDCLTFGCSTLLKGFKGKKEKIFEIDLKIVLEKFELDYDQFVDFCILSGCDYCDSIKNLGPVKSLKFIQEHKNIEAVLEFLKKENEAGKSKLKYIIPTGDNFLYEEARQLFKQPDVLKETPKVEFLPPNETELKKFLVDEKGFNSERVEKRIKTLVESKKKKAQISLEAFFGKPIIKTPTVKKSKPKRSSMKKRIKKY